MFTVAHRSNRKAFATGRASLGSDAGIIGNGEIEGFGCQGVEVLKVEVLNTETPPGRKPLLAGG